jgi:hypothetical protein
MIRLRCLHGIDTRFCAICNRPKRDERHGVPPGTAGDASLTEIIQFLNHQQVRATYGAVAELLRAMPRSMSTRLGARRAEASWVVSATTGLPTKYGAHEMHPALRAKREIIGSGGELMKQLSAWKATRQA